MNNQPLEMEWVGANEALLHEKCADIQDIKSRRESRANNTRLLLEAFRNHYMRTVETVNVLEIREGNVGKG